MRVCFLFNHYAAHQVAHAAPFAFELSRREPGASVVVACTSAAQLEAAARIGALYPGHRAELVQLRMSLGYRALDALLSRFVFVAKRGMLASNLAFFRAFDAVVAPEKNCLELRTRYGLRELRLIHTRHGAGDREGSFDPRTLDFDLTLVSGRKIVDRLTAEGLLREGHYAVVGYPKLELAEASAAPESRRWFANDRPVVLYNPHFDSRVGSWRAQGHAVLRWFAAHPEYNLLFAPHVVLFQRRWRHGARLPRGIEHAPNIRSDLGSAASTDMTYALGADLYLGDVSSQVYEFIARPRPCVFLNVHGVRWEGDPSYAHWRFGPVIERADELGPALARAQAELPAFAEAQRAALEYTFSREADRTAAQRGADAIRDFLRAGKVEPHAGGAQAPSPNNRAR